MVDILASALGVKPRIEFLPMYLGDVTVADIDRVRRILNFHTPARRQISGSAYLRFGARSLDRIGRLLHLSERRARWRKAQCLLRACMLVNLFRSDTISRVLI
jgi:hypothetical protein